MISSKNRGEEPCQRNTAASSPPLQRDLQRAGVLDKARSLSGDAPATTPSLPAAARFIILPVGRHTREQPRVGIAAILASGSAARAAATVSAVATTRLQLASLPVRTICSIPCRRISLSTCSRQRHSPLRYRITAGRMAALAFLNCLLSTA